MRTLLHVLVKKMAISGVVPPNIVMLALYPIDIAVYLIFVGNISDNKAIKAPAIGGKTIAIKTSEKIEALIVPLAAALNIQYENNTNPTAPVPKINFLFTISDNHPIMGTRILSTTNPKKLISIV